MVVNWSVRLRGMHRRLLPSRRYRQAKSLSLLATVALSLLLASVSYAATPATFTVHTVDTYVTLTAGRRAMYLKTLCPARGACWHANALEPFLPSIQIDGRSQPLAWRRNPGADRSSESMVSLVYETASPSHLQLTAEWRSDPIHPGPIEHTIRIRNLGTKDVHLPLQDSFQTIWRLPLHQSLRQMWLEKGAGGPSAEGTHRVSISSSYIWNGTSSTYAHPAPGQPREIIPYILVGDPGEQGSGWYLGIEFSGRTRIHLARHQQQLEVTAGLNPQPGPYLTRLAPGEIFEAPAIFLGTYQHGPDGAANVLHRWVRSTLNNPATLQKPDYPFVVNNSWGSGMAIDAEQARRMIRDSAELGFEMFHLDAGWFRGVGDWQPDPAKFPNGLAPIADYAHDHGLKFGLWMDWALAARQKTAVLSVDNPRVRPWLTTDPPDGWKPEESFKGSTMDLGLPAVHAWADTELNRVVTDYHLDMLEHDGYVVAQGCDRRDHPHAPPDPESTHKYEDSGFWWIDSSNSTDVSYFATRAYYDIYSRLRHEHPGLLLEICNDGGRMVDFGSAAHGDYFSISDAYDPLSNRRAFYDSSYALPSAMLETYVQSWPSSNAATFLYGLRSGMMGWFTLMLDTTNWTPAQHTAAKEAIALYKTRLRPLIRNADLYHVSARPDSLHWDGMEYIDQQANHGVLFAFRGTAPGESSHRFALRGVTPDAQYRITFQDKSAPDQVTEGSTLMLLGLDVTLPEARTSELIFFDRITH